MDSIFVPDSNILVSWVHHHIDTQSSPISSNPGCSAQCAAFCENPGNPMIIPELVWGEFHGVIYQKDIDLEDYLQWHRLRKAAVAPVYAAVYATESHISLENVAYDVDLPINLSVMVIDDDLKGELSRLQQRRREKYGWDAPRPAKLLDGIDAIILACAWQLASEHSSKQVFLVTNDISLQIMIRHLRGRKITRKAFPDNLKCMRISPWGPRRCP